MVNPILVALDFNDRNDTLDMARTIQDSVGGYKVGLELMMSVGPRIVSDLAGLGLPVFADAKLHDIPNTVRGAAAALSARGARWITVHAFGGHEMIEAANHGLAEGSGGKAGALAVTVLTSLDDSDLDGVGCQEGVASTVGRLADIATRAGAEGVICSPNEAGLVKARSPKLLAVTPGIRPAGADTHDQKRTATPAEAVRAQADLLVVGRAITAAPDPAAAAAEIAEQAGAGPG